MSRKADRNRDEFWAGRDQAARTAADKAVVEWDRLRAAVEGLPRGDRDAAWDTVRAKVGRLRSDLTESAFATDVRITDANRSGGLRVDARERARGPAYTAVTHGHDRERKR